MDRILWELRPRGRRYGILCSALDKMDGFIYGPEKSYGRRLYVVHCSPAHRALRRRFKECSDYYLAFIHQVTGKDIEKYRFTYVQLKHRHIRSFEPHWSGPSCPGGKEVGPHGLVSEMTPEVRYRDLPDFDIFQEGNTGMILVSRAGMAAYESAGLSGLTFSPCLDKDAEGEESRWYVVEALYSSAVFVNDMHPRLLAFCDGCGRYFGGKASALLAGDVEGAAVTYLDAATLEPLDFQIPRHARTRIGQVDNIPRQQGIIVSRTGRRWLESMRGGCGTVLAQPRVAYWVVETAPVSQECVDDSGDLDA